MTRFKPTSIARCLVCLGALGLAAGAQAEWSGPGQIATFKNGNSGWTGPKGPGGRTEIDATMGDGAPALHTRFSDFGITFSNRRAAWLAPFKAPGAVMVGLEANTQAITMGQREVPRTLVVEIRDYDNPPSGEPYVAVWAELGTLTANQPGWQLWSKTISDTQATALPKGWRGTGAYNDSYEPILPADRTFASVLAGADEIVFTTLVPGYMYADAAFDVALDNITVRPVPLR